MGRGKRAPGTGSRAHVSEQLATAHEAQTATITAPHPKLVGRQARCSSCKTLVPSSPDLAFFEFRGEGSRSAAEICGTCHFGHVAHNDKAANRRVNHKVCDNFKPIGAWEYDLFYCGCRGWD